MDSLEAWESTGKKSRVFRKVIVLRPHEEVFISVMPPTKQTWNSQSGSNHGKQPLKCAAKYRLAITGKWRSDRKGLCHRKIDKKQGRLEKEEKVGETECETSN